MTILQEIFFFLHKYGREKMLKKICFVIVLLFVFSNMGICYSEENLSAIEFSRYGQSYENESLSSRLMRLESDLMGMTQSGDIDSRIELISRMADNSDLSAVQPNNIFYPEKKKSAIRNFWDNVTSSTSSGSLTGFTPSMDSTGYYNSMNNNGFWDFFNSSPSFNPYYNPNTSCTYNSFYRNTPYFRNHLLNHPFERNISERKRHFHRRAPYQRYYGNNFGIRPNYNNPYYNYGRAVPTNINSNYATRSAIHILKD